MYYNDYEDYMRNVLGYQNANDGTYQRYDNSCCGMSCNNCNYNDINYSNMGYNNMPYGSNMSMNQMGQFEDRNDSATIEQMYPEIYRIINPMVCRMCDNNNQPVTEYMIEQMTDDIYDNVVNRVEIQNVVNLNIGTRDSNVEVNVDGETGDNNRGTNTASANRSSLNSTSNSSANNSTTSKMASSTKQEEERENRSTHGRQRRNGLLRDLIRILILNRLQGRRPNRPNRPPFRPGQRPGMPGNNRPPIPRMDDYYMPNNHIPYM